MANLKFDKEITALLVIDPYNDFISEGGKVWGRLKTVAEANDCISHTLQVLNAARKAELRVFDFFYLKLYCAGIHLSEPVSFTATSQMKTCRGMAANRDLPKLRSSCTTVVPAR